MPLRQLYCYRYVVTCSHQSLAQSHRHHTWQSIDDVVLWRWFRLYDGSLITAFCLKEIWGYRLTSIDHNFDRTNPNTRHIHICEGCVSMRACHIPDIIKTLKLDRHTIYMYIYIYIYIYIHTCSVLITYINNKKIPNPKIPIFELLFQYFVIDDSKGSIKSRVKHLMQLERTKRTFSEYGTSTYWLKVFYVIYENLGNSVC